LTSLSRSLALTSGGRGSASGVVDTSAFWCAIAALEFSGSDLDCVKKSRDNLFCSKPALNSVHIPPMIPDNVSGVPIPEQKL